MRLIDADALVKTMDDYVTEHNALRDVERVDGVLIAKSFIDEQPTVEPIPVMTYPQVDGITPTLIDWTKRETQTGESKTVVTGNPAYPLGGGGNYRCSNTANANHILDATKKVDAVQVVRCKDCKWWDKKDDAPYGYCMAMQHGFVSSHWEIGIYRTYKGDFYCADGERREDDEAD